MVRIASLDQKGVPEPKWLAHTYGIQWNGNGKLLRGTANVLLIQEERTNQRLVMRLSNPASIGASRLDRAHRFLEYLSGRGVRTPIPLRTCEGKTYAIHQASGKLVEIFSYIDGRSPQIGNLEDAQRVAVALAEFHNAGVFYEDLPDEETCHLYHVALERLKVDVEGARVTSVGKIFETLLREYLDDAEVIIASFQKLRPKLVETGLLAMGNAMKIMALTELVCRSIFKNRRTPCEGNTVELRSDRGVDIQEENTDFQNARI